MGSDQLSKTYVLFIDILYAVTLGIALGEISTLLNLPHCLKNVVSLPFLLFLGSLLIVGRDWIVYHVDISKRPHKSPLRFALDIMILFFFFQLVKTYSSPSKFFLVTTFYFVTIVIWTIFELLEYRNDELHAKEVKSNIIWNIGLAFLFLGTWIALIILNGETLCVAISLVSLLIYGICIFFRWRHGDSLQRNV